MRELGRKTTLISQSLQQDLPMATRKLDRKIGRTTDCKTARIDAPAVDPRSAAQALYAALTERLSRDLEALTATADAPEQADPKAAAERAALVKAHAKALFALLDCDAARDPTASDAPKGGALDLAAARLEIARRLDRLANAEDARPVSKGAEPERDGGPAVDL